MDYGAQTVRDLRTLLAWSEALLCQSEELQASLTQQSYQYQSLACRIDVLRLRLHLLEKRSGKHIAPNHL